MAKIPEIDEIKTISSYEHYTETWAYIAHFLQGWFLFAKKSKYTKFSESSTKYLEPEYTLGAIPARGPTCPIDCKNDFTCHPKAKFEI